MIDSKAEWRQFGAGDLAFHDCGPWGGMIPCRVVSVDAPGDGRTCNRGRVTVRLTATRGPWKRGETITGDTVDVIPRPMARRRRLGWAIDVRYRWA